MIEVKKATHTGFCFGVKRAVTRVLEEAARTGKPLYTLGPLLHNPKVVEDLKAKGIIPIDDVRKIDGGTVAFRSHGVMKEEEIHIRERGLKAIDTTCPFVKRVRQCALLLGKAGYTVVIVGDKEHPEVKSVLSYLDNDGIVLQNPCTIESKKVGIVSQTTQDQDVVSRVVMGLLEGAKELRIYNTICESTSERKREAVLLASSVDAMLVVGGRNSSNTTKLYGLVKKVQPRTFLVESDDEIKPEWLAGARKVGLAAGASTPEEMIGRVERLVKNF